MTAPTRLISAPWATVADLPDTRPTLSDDTWDDLLWSASELLYLWSGKQFNGSAASMVTLTAPPDSSSDYELMWRGWGMSPWGDPWVSPWGSRRGREQVVAKLPDAPVTGVSSVVLDSAELTPGVDYTLDLPAGLITLRDELCWDKGAQVTYTHGIAPPIGGKRAAVLLAIELGKSWTGQKCALPKRVETITREGLTIGMATTLNGWRTGLWDIDAWISSVNPHMMARRASAWSPDKLRARRTTT